MIITIIVFILVLGILVFVHEFGHFIVAKLSGVKVEEFAFGFPPTLWSKKKGETKYLINLLPIGGYVKMLGEEANVNNPKSYSTQPTKKKIAIIVAGVIMNLVLAWLLLSIGFAVGMSPIISSPESIQGEIIKSSVIIADTKDGSPAEKAGLIQGDQIVDLIYQNQSVEINKGSDLTDFTTSHKGGTINLTFLRDGDRKTTEIILSNDETQPLGIAAVDDSIVRVKWYRAPLVAISETGKIFKLTFDFLGNLFAGIFTKGQVSGDVGGPIAIYVYTGMAVQLGFMAVLQFIAILSVNLALINILPLPALDGGKILFLILRKIMGKHFIKEQIENIIHSVGFALLIILMILLTIKDIKRFF